MLAKSYLDSYRSIVTSAKRTRIVSRANDNRYFYCLSMRRDKGRSGGAKEAAPTGLSTRLVLDKYYQKLAPSGNSINFPIVLLPSDGLAAATLA